MPRIPAAGQPSTPCSRLPAVVTVSPARPAQVRPELVAERDERYGVSTEDKGRQRRERLEWPEALDPAADHWQSGTAWQITGLEQVPVQGLRGSAAGAPAAGSAAGGSQLD